MSEDDIHRAESRLFRAFEKKAVWTKRDLGKALNIKNIKIVDKLLKDCCVRINKHKWGLDPTYIVEP
jgi:hypothetical protein